MQVRIYATLALAGALAGSNAYAQDAAPVPPAQPSAPAQPPVSSVTVPAPTPVQAIPSLAQQRLNGEATAPVLTLNDAIVMALENNPQISIAQASLAAAQARVKEAHAAGGPNANINATVSDVKPYGPTSFSLPAGAAGGGAGGGASSSNLFNTGITEAVTPTLNVPIYSGGKAKYNTRAAQFAAQEQAEQTLQTQHDLVTSTIQAYLTILRNQQLLDVANSNVTVSTEQARIATVRYNAGAAARLEVLRANNTYAQAVARQAAAADTLVQSKATLNTLLNRAPETSFKVETIDSLNPTTPLPSVLRGNGAASAPETTTGDLRTIADTSRPSLAAAANDVQAANQRIEVAKSARKPNIGFSLSGLLNNPASFLGRFILSLGLSATQTLYDSGLAKAQIQEAQALAEQSRQNERLQRANVANQIDQSLLSLDSAQQRLHSTQAAVEEAAEALHSAQIGYQAGAQTSLDVSDAQNALLQSQTDAVNARFDLAGAQAQLASSIGVLTKEGQAALQKALQDQAKAENDKANIVEAKDKSTTTKKRHKFLGIF